MTDERPERLTDEELDKLEAWVRAHPDRETSGRLGDLVTMVRAERTKSKELDQWVTEQRAVLDKMMAQLNQLAQEKVEVGASAAAMREALEEVISDVEQQGWEEGVDRWKAALSFSAGQSLLDELRAAREVVEVANGVMYQDGHDPKSTGAAKRRLIDALARYEKVVKR